MLSLGTVKVVLGFDTPSFSLAELTFKSVKVSLILTNLLVADLVLLKLIILVLQDVVSITLILKGLLLVKVFLLETAELLLKGRQGLVAFVLNQADLLSQEVDLSSEESPLSSSSHHGSLQSEVVALLLGVLKFSIHPVGFDIRGIVLVSLTLLVLISQVLGELDIGVMVSASETFELLL